jgi:peptidoglycan-associated lipoprotein
MRVAKCHFLALLLLLAAVSMSACRAQVSPQAIAVRPPRAEVALEYSSLRSNAPPGGCACFNLQGGSASFAWPIKAGGSFALAAETTVAAAGAIGASGYSLTLSSYTAGARYQIKLRQAPLRPYLQALLGVAHSSGSLVGTGSPAANAGAAFAANLGGGFDLRVSRRFSFRLADFDYLLTAFDNGGNNRQNNLRIGAGMVLRF